MRFEYGDDLPYDEGGRFAEVSGNGNKYNTGDIDLNIRPTATNPRLQSIIDDIYKGRGNKKQVGNGSVMDAVRNEIKAGKPTNKRFHAIKARETTQRLKKQIASGMLNAQDKRIARALIEDISKALSGH